MSAAPAGLLGQALDGLFACELPVGLAVLDCEQRYVRINKTLAEFNGLSVDAHLGRCVAEVLPEAHPTLGPMLDEVLQQGWAFEHFRVQVRVPSDPERASEWEASYLPIADPDGSVSGVLVKAINVSLQQQAQRALRESEARVRQVLDGLFAFVGVLTPKGVLLEANRAPLEAAGITLDEVQGRALWDTYWWSYDPALQQWLREAIAEAAGGGVLRQDVVVRMADDTRMTIDFMIAPLRNEAGDVTHLVASAIDISERIATVRALRASEARFRSAFDAAPVGMTLVDTRGRMLLANRSMGQLFATEAAALVGLEVSNLVPVEDRGVHARHMSGFFAAPATRLMSRRGNLQALRSDGSRFHVEVGLNPIPGSEPMEVLATITDIDERLAAQAQLERALQEKTALLHEVHHRVKNNLQIIASLLRLQSLNVDEGARAALRDSKSRVRAMALMHELLYERNDFTGIELGPYLRRLLSLLREAYVAPALPVELQVDAVDEGMRIDMQQAIPCGLLVNELVTNALKHAFPGGRRGQVWISARALDGGAVRVEVRDDGIGLAPEMRFGDGQSLGFQLIPMLAEQLEADLSVLDGPGTGIRLEFLPQGVKP